jgi:hypothetical protein
VHENEHWAMHNAVMAWPSVVRNGRIRTRCSYAPANGDEMLG